MDRWMGDSRFDRISDWVDTPDLVVMVCVDANGE